MRELAAGKGFLFADRGDTALRGFEDPVRLYAALTLTAGAWMPGGGGWGKAALLLANAIVGPVIVSAWSPPVAETMPQ